MNEILKLLNALKADELEDVILRANILLEKKRRDEAEEAIREQERLRQEKIEQERKRQQEIAELQRKLQELQSQQVEIPEKPGVVQGSGFVMYESSAGAAKPAPEAAKPQSAQMVSCPHCGHQNVEGSRFCANCGQSVAAPAAATQPAPQPAPQQPAAPQVRYADVSATRWEMLPGEKSLRGQHDIELLQPDGGKFAYYMEVTSHRILFSRESAGAKKATTVARMGGGLVGALIAEGIKSASGAGPKPWLEIPLSAVSSCGLQGKKEFFLVADRTYVLKNKSYEKFLPDMVAKAKA